MPLADSRVPGVSAPALVLVLKVLCRADVNRRKESQREQVCACRLDKLILGRELKDPAFLRQNVVDRGNGCVCLASKMYLDEE